jgi:DNA-binding MurR/RpiR family transcriptional regulator
MAARNPTPRGQNAFQQRVHAAYDALPPQLRLVGQWVMDHPREVALLSTREQARRVCVPVATMTRFAQRLGFAGYDEVRQIHADNVRRLPVGFVGKAEAMVARRKKRGAAALAFDLVEAMTRNVGALASETASRQLVEAVRILSRAEHVYALGQRSSFAVAFHFQYVRAFSGGEVTLVDGAGGTGIDRLRQAGRNDALLVVSVRPYTRLTVDYAAYAAKRGVTIVALTDSSLAPIARLAKASVVVSTESPSFFHTMTPAFAAAEALAALLAADAGEEALAAIAAADRELLAVDAYVTPTRPRRPTR